MTRIEAVTKLIERYRTKADAHRYMAEAADKHADNLKEYLYQLQSPGFRTPGRNRYTGPGRNEPYVVQAGDTQG
jgi:hypothetical protein